MVRGYVFPMYYFYNDDSLTSELLSGVYTGDPSPYSVFIKSPLSLFFTGLYKLMPAIPWYPVILLLLMIVPSVALLYITRRNKKELAINSVILFLTIIPASIQLTFTLEAAALIVIALLYLSTDCKYTPYIGGFLLALSYCVRSEMFIVGVAFSMVVLLWKLFQKDLKSFAGFLGSLIICTGLFFACNSLLYNSAGWDEFYEVNTQRVNVYDYTWYIPYENAPQLYEAHNVSYEDYLLIDNYALSLEEKNWSGILKEIADITYEYYPPYSLAGQLYHAASAYIKYSISHLIPFGVLIYFTYIYVWCISIRKKKFALLFTSLCLFAGRNLIWLYLFWRGRFPDRVSFSICAIECATLAILIKALISKESLKFVCPIVVSLNFAAAVFMIVTTAITCHNQSLLNSRFDSLQEYMLSHPDKTYLLDVRSVNNFSEKIWHTSSTPNNYFQVGGWYCNSPVLQQRVKALVPSGSGVQSPDCTDILVLNPDVTFVIDEHQSLDWVVRYVASRYPEAALIIEDTVESGGTSYHILNFSQN